MIARVMEKTVRVVTKYKYARHSLWLKLFLGAVTFLGEIFFFLMLVSLNKYYD